jgi:hypothetical protein
MSKAADINLWGIHAGKTDATDSLFPKKNCIAVSWANMHGSGCEKAAIKHTIYVHRQAPTVSTVSTVETCKSFRE